MLTAEVLGNLPGGELRFADVPKVPGQVDRFTCLKNERKNQLFGKFWPSGGRERDYTDGLSNKKQFINIELLLSSLLSTSCLLS